MCTKVYLASEKEIPEIKWNEESPGFYLDRVDPKVYDDLTGILNLRFIYELGSHMGCSCGLSYGEWSLNDKEDKHDQRVKDVSDFANYLSTHMHQNRLQIFCTEWDDVQGHYDEKDFRLSGISKEEFDFEDDVVLNVV